MPGGLLSKLGAMIAGTGDLDPEADPELALACLLAEAARADGRVEEAEREMAIALLARRGRSREEAAALFARAERLVADAVQLLPWTRAIKDGVPLDERVAVIEQLFAVAFADGRLDPLEDQLIRRVAGLLYVPDRARGQAARRVRARLADGA